MAWTTSVIIGSSKWMCCCGIWVFDAESARVKNSRRVSSIFLRDPLRFWRWWWGGPARDLYSLGSTRIVNSRGCRARVLNSILTFVLPYPNSSRGARTIFKKCCRLLFMKARHWSASLRRGPFSLVSWIFIISFRMTIKKETIISN